MVTPWKVRTFVFGVLVAALVASSCEETAPAAQSDNREVTYDSGQTVPVDEVIYTMVVEVQAAPMSLTRQTERGSASITGFSGYVGGSAIGPEFEGKGFLRVLVLESDPVPDFLELPGTVVVKTTDTKAVMLGSGDVVTIRCRVQYEAVAPIRQGEKLTREHATHELDFCRLRTPQVRQEPR